MATIVLSAAGAAIGGSIGGTVAGISSAAIGRAIGATVGRAIDERLLGAGSEPVETGKVERFRLTQAGDGAPIPQVFGRMRVGGQVIWASDFKETSSTTGGGGKGLSRSSQPKTTTYSYSVSLAIAVCEGEITTIGRVWADGEEVSRDDLNMRIYRGTRDQLPDPAMEAVEGAGFVPAYRGVAYVVMEDIQLGQFGNRVPTFSFEVVRAEQPGAREYPMDLAQSVRGVAMIPGTGEYSLATQSVYYAQGQGTQWPANLNAPSGKADFLTSHDALREEIPSCDAVSLVVSWFGNDLRCGSCTIEPKVTQKEAEGANMVWSVSDMERESAKRVELEDGRPVYGGTPADAAVIESIQHMRASGQRVMFYPFILMDQLEGNTLTNPWTGEQGQPKLPWRGRITLSLAPGQDGSPDGTSAADTEVAQFVGTVTPAHFFIEPGRVTYSGPQEWSMRRFILHNAALCAAAGGVDAFCIGSEMRSFTQIRGANGFPAVDALRAILHDVRAMLGETVKLGYAADWSEYFGYQPSFANGDRYFHLDPLWAEEDLDFIGIDNYMPISDWRDGEDHRDLNAGWGAIYDLDYLRSNIEGGEGYDWFYASSDDNQAQIRTPIEDAEAEEWIWRYKDLRNWWSQPHHERIGGIRQETATAWMPQSKPIWFTELGCAAIDKGTNQPNKFLDPKSSESSVPRHSNGLRDDFIQVQYLRAMLTHWNAPENNPVSYVYGGSMIDMSNAYVWAWDARPFPVFPNNGDLWSDGPNYLTGHWLNGRVGARTLASVVEEICRKSGMQDIDTSNLYGLISGYLVDEVLDARAALQPLMLRYGFDAIERGGTLVFQMRNGRVTHVLDPETFVDSDEVTGRVERSREPDLDLTGRLRVRFLQSGADYDVAAEEAILPEDRTHSVATRDLPMAMTRREGVQTAERWLTEARVSREQIRFALPPSQMPVGAGDVVSLQGQAPGADARYRVDRVEQAGFQIVDAVRIEPQVYLPSELPDEVPRQKTFLAPAPVTPLFLDVPLLSGDEVPHAPHIAIAASRWPGDVALFSSNADENYGLETLLEDRSIVGVTETPMSSAPLGRWDDGAALNVRLVSGALESRSESAVLNGANLAAIGDGSNGNWEVFQFQNAELAAPDTYALTRRLRGQVGSDARMPQSWPAGSWFVLLNGIPEQIALSSGQRGLERHYRIGPAARSFSDGSYVYRREVFQGNGLRPYAPCHLSFDRAENGNTTFNWIRRTRIDGDSWELDEVPLGEDFERYRVRVWQNGSLRHERFVDAPNWSYTSAQRNIDGVVAPYQVEVAQVSQRYGAGGASIVTVDTDPS